MVNVYLRGVQPHRSHHGFQSRVISADCGVNAKIYIYILLFLQKFPSAFRPNFTRQPAYFPFNRQIIQLEFPPTSSCLADAIHNFKWVKLIQIWQNGDQQFQSSTGLKADM